jgi:4-amino-4-deoxy-L-arabinose transferase-like glycosyltransferase
VPAAAVGAIIWLLAARIAGPSDLWDQRQPRTVSYTTDIIANGRWALPVERGTVGATKPPLYNWIAVPAVRIGGFASEPAHKLPSMLAIAACWLAAVLYGERIAAGAGWLAGMMLASSLMMFKLGYLARPDMLLALWLLLGWMLATEVLVAHASRAAAGGSRGAAGVAMAAAFWLCVGLAALTKGPPALVLPIYALVAAPLVGGGRGAARAFGWWWGAPLALAVFGAWLAFAWRADAEHVRANLGFGELLGHAAGIGPEGDDAGPGAIPRQLPFMTLYYLSRFAPWSILSGLAILMLWTRDGPDRPRHWRCAGRSGRVLQGAALFVIVVVAFFTLGARKRADYVAPAVAPGALLAAWWLIRAAGPRRWPVVASLVASGAILLGLTIWNERDDAAPAPGFGDEIVAFARAAGEIIEREPHPVAFTWTGSTLLQAMLGFSEAEGTAAIVEMARGEGPFWVVAGPRGAPPVEFADWLGERRPRARATAVLRSAALPRADEWAGQVTLYRVEPRAGPPNP